MSSLSNSLLLCYITRASAMLMLACAKISVKSAYPFTLQVDIAQESVAINITTYSLNYRVND